MRVCQVEGCNRKHSRHDYCELHYKRMSRYGRTELLSNRINKNGSSRRADGSGYIDEYGYVIYGNGGNDNREHVLVAEKALGKSLPKGAIIHHIDKNPSNNNPWNLVICPNQTYHNLIHQRMRALEAC